MIYPVDPRFPITQKYGEHPDWYPATRGHNGLDFGLPEGNPIFSVCPGLVTFASLDPATEAAAYAGYGLHIRIQGPRFLVIYGHLTALQVKRDNQVTCGQVIGLTGGRTPPTGFSTGPHLHFELRTASSLATCIDPFPLLDRTEVPNRPILFYAEVTCKPYLMVRTGPGSNFSASGTLQPGEIVPVYALAGKEAWIEHDRGFSAFRITSEALMRVKDS
jgi:hypothetical protein